VKPEDEVRLKALIDQAFAAGAQGQNFMASFLREKGGVAEQDKPLFGAVAVVMNRYDLMMQSGLLARCQHLAGVGPQPMFWVPFAPHLLRCFECCKVVNEQIAGTVEDRTCDACGTVEEEGFVYSCAVERPPVVLARPFFRSYGPVIVHFGLCRVCHKTSYPESP